jgi:hypothetical protein
MGLLTSYSAANLVVEEGLVVTYSRQKISGQWSWTSANMSGTHYYMNEYRRYATKSFKYVGMTYAAAKSCRDAMVKYFARSIKIDAWDDSCADGQWVSKDGGSMLMTTVTLTHDDGCMWSVRVRVNENDVHYSKEGEVSSYTSVFSSERTRSYGGDGNGGGDEKEA